LDLSFSRFVSDGEVTALPGDLAVLMVGVAARQAASPTALAHAGSVRATSGYGSADPRLFAPLDGAFNGPMAARLGRWRQE
jgi:hypothetical protein